MMTARKLLTARVLAEKLNLSVDTIWRYTRENKIPYIVLGNRQYRYKLADVTSVLSAGTVREREPGYKTDSCTYQDYLNLPDEPGFRFEVLNGELIKEPSPNVKHQRASRQLMLLLAEYFKLADPTGEVFDAPLDVTLDDKTVVQPDLFYISGEQKEVIEFARINGSPALVVEIVSVSTSRKDRVIKMALYKRAQVRHYWLVNPEDRTLECFALLNDLYSLVASGMDDDKVVHPQFPGLIIDLESVWHS